MTKRDYEVIADAICKATKNDQHMRNEITLLLCKSLRKDNSRFMPAKFVKACGADVSVLLVL